MCARADVVVVGGGPAGTAAAALLAARGLGVTLLERTRYETARIGEVLSPAVVPLLESLGLARQFLAGGHLPSPGVVSVWGGAKSERPALLNPYGDSWHVDRARFDRMLAGAATAVGVTLYTGAWLARVQHDDAGDGWVAEFTTLGRARTLRARFLIDATGRSAKLARRLGARQERADRLVAVVASGETRAGADPRMLVEAAEGGWWYSALLPSGRTAFAYLTDSDLLPRTRGGRGHLGGFATALRRAPQTSERARGVTFSQPRVTAAASTRLTPPAGPGWLAVGDAAISFDPLSAHGVARALASAIDAARVVAEGLSGPGRDEDWLLAQSYARQCGLSWSRYLDERGRIYGGERRWPDSVFWRRRWPPTGRPSTHSSHSEVDHEQTK